MYCKFCGTNNPSGDKFCNNCGSSLIQNTYEKKSNFQTDYTPNTYNQSQYSQFDPYQNPAQNYNPYIPPAPKPGLGLAIAGMVCGILSLLCFAYILGTLGIIFGAVAKGKGCRSGMATAGIVCGILGIALWILIRIVFIF